MEIHKDHQVAGKKCKSKLAAAKRRLCPGSRVSATALDRIGTKANAYLPPLSRHDPEHQ
jgi:hypothetical protein